MYRPEWFTKTADGRNVLTMALEVHSTKTGSLERSPSDQEADIKALSWLVENWAISDRDFDKLVLELIVCALGEES